MVRSVVFESDSFSDNIVTEEIMSVGKSFVAFMAICYLAILIIGCTGDEGPIGPPGFPGTEGPPGQNAVISPIADRTFGILVANSSASDLVGAAKVILTSDTNSVPGSDRVVARRLDKAPVIDGADGGDAEWGSAAASTITLDSIAGKYNGIASAHVRAAYDRQYVYLQVKWTEVAISDFAPSKDVNKLMWSYDSAGTNSWVRTGGEDMLCLGWQLTTITGWSTDGIKAIFDGSIFRTPASGEVADLWVWQSTETYYSGYLGDRVVRYADVGDASQFDAGTLPAFALENPASSGKPTYMRSGSPETGTSYPLNSYEFTKFDTQKKWKNHATIPGYISFIPSGSTADVQSTAIYDNGTWTVELRRLRQTGNGDDTIL
ncbi:MAG: hypothetical protein E4G91_05155 [Candidatus Zixiibacteriota bacterium]|nr:MAG: hypothetical protein E4G91_05155 [candidate division Zixibacteria bacterium]